MASDQQRWQKWQRLQSLRASELRQAQLELARRQRQLTGLRSKKQQLQRQWELLVDDAAGARQGQLEMPALAGQQQDLRHLQAELQQTEEQLDEISRAVEEQRQLVVERQQEVKKFEQLADAARNAFLERQQAARQRFLDDWPATQFGR